MPIPLTQKEFIAKAILKHGNRYDYSKAQYNGSKTNVAIICQEHGMFYQTPNNHLRGNGCYLCRNKLIAENRSSRTTYSIIKHCKKIMPQYDYSKLVYKHHSLKVKVMCHKHGEWEAVVSDLLEGHGCKECGYESITKPRIGRAKLIKLANEIHNNKYNYSFIPVNVKVLDFVKIVCPKHGEFNQKLSPHINGQGCPNCALIKPEINGYTKERWLNVQKGRMATFYLVRCTNQGEVFYKVGITFLKLKYRLKKIPYTTEVVYSMDSIDAERLYDLERKVKQDMHEHQYIPQLKFKGKTECFNKPVDLSKYLNQKIS